jgi:very-short-patch-repair endonuclease
LPTQPVTRALLLASGVTVPMIRTQLAAGRLMRLRQGAMVSAASWPDGAAEQHLVRAHAEQVANPEAVLSHESAAVAWGLPSPDFGHWHDAPVSLTLPAAAQGSRHRGASWHIAELPVADIARDAEGYRITALARTAVDLAAGRRLPETLVILDGAGRLLVDSFVTSPRRSDYVNPRLVSAARAELLQAAGRRSLARLRRFIDLVEPCRESAAESMTAGHLVLAGIPTPKFQAPIKTAMGTYYADFYWPAAGLVGECDGAVKYDSTNSILLEKEREQAVRDEGYGVVRWLAKHIWTRPYEVMGRIERALCR